MDDQASIEILATPHEVWSVISDPTRMGDWSPVCRRCEWVEGWDAPALGARFVGHNRQMGARWSRYCVITTFEPDRAVVFETLFRGAPSTRWRYLLEPSEAATTLTESYEILAMPRWVALTRMFPPMRSYSQAQGHRGIERTLVRIKAEVESSD